MPGSHSILIIDDDAISREVMAMTLEMHGYAVTAATDGERALATLQIDEAASFPDLVLMDTQMPGLSGLELINALRSAGAKRIVAISGSEPGEAIRDAADGFLLKPVQSDAISALFSTPLAVMASPDQNPADTNISASPAVDPETLAKFRAMMPVSAVREIYAATAADMAVRLKTLEAAAHASDRAEVARIAHSIKGSCAMVGMTAGREAAARLETSDLSGTWGADIMQLHIALEALEVMLADDFSA